MPNSYPVLFVNMPFGGIDRPAIGVSSLKSNLEARGFACEIAYLNLQFAQLIGVDLYEKVSNSGQLHEDSVPYTRLVGEWLFSQHLYGRNTLDTTHYIEHILRPRLADALIEQLLHARSHIAAYLQDCFDQIEWEAYQFIGFTSTFEQNLASLALAQMVKAHYPHLFVAFGGGNCEGQMGVTLAEQYPFIDAVCTGEGDVALPELLDALQNGRAPVGIPGLIWRDVVGNLVDNGRPEVVQNLEALPIPCFDDYFAQLDAVGLRHAVRPLLIMEASRGCWWGAKKHCTFCGLNSYTMTYRRKSSARVLQEIAALVERYQLTEIAFVDNILDYDALKSYVVTLSEQDHNLHIFCETKSNLRKDQIALLAAAGIREVQPGIESFDSHTLDLMQKGVSGLQNVAFLKWAQQYGVGAFWNILYGFPEETAVGYEHQLEVMRRITHLNLPSSVGKIRLDRFSPHFTQSEAFGFSGVRPLPAYQHIYPFTEAVLSRLAYFFDYDYQDGRNPDEYTRPLAAFWHKWRKVKIPGSLTITTFDDGTAEIRDTRFNRRLDQLSLDQYQAAIYKICDKPQSVQRIVQKLRQQFPERPFTQEKVVAYLQFMWLNYFMVREEDMYLSVALPAEFVNSITPTYQIEFSGGN